MNLLHDTLAECRRRNAKSLRCLDELHLELMSPAQRQEVAALRSEIAITNAMIDQVEATLMAAEARGHPLDGLATMLRNTLNPGGNGVLLADRVQALENGRSGGMS